MAVLSRFSLLNKIMGSVEAGGGAGRQAAPTSLGAGGVDGVGGAQKRKVRSVTGDP